MSVRTTSLLPIILAATALAATAAEYPLPDDVPAMKNVQRDYGAKGDGRTDDTQALDQCFRQEGGKKYLLGYLPNGTYLVSDTIAYGNRRCWMHGESRERTIIKLRDNCPGFQDPENPKPVLLMANAWDRRDEWNSGVMFRQEVHNVTVDVGRGNPGAVGIAFMTNNAGTLSNVAIRSQDGQGAYGLSLDLAWPGPALMKDLVIEGFDYGIHSTIGQYSITFKRLILRNQNRYAIWNDEQSLFMQDVISEQRGDVPFLKTKEGLIALLRGRLQGRGDAAISARKAKLYIRDLETSGYGAAVETDRGTASGPRVEEFCTERPSSLFVSRPAMLDLPIEEPPEIPWGPLDGWVNPEDFGAENGGEVDATAAIQAAIDSGAHTVFLGPKGYYRVTDTLILRGNVRRFTGLGGRLVLKNDGAPKPLFRIEDGTAPAVVIERIQATGSNFQPHFLHDTERTLVLRNMIMSGLENTKPARFFLEDVCGTGWTFSNGAQAWLWQFNTESRDRWNLTVDDAQVFVLGHKTEGGRTCLTARNGARVEIVGGWFYPHGAKDEIGVHIVDSAVSLFSGTPRFPKAVVETHGGETRSMDRRGYTGLYIADPVTGR